MPGASEQQMRDWLDQFSSSGGGRVIIFQNGCPAQVGPHDSEIHRDAGGKTYNIYLGARGDWVNKGDRGWVNWAFTGHREQNGAHVQF